MSNPTKLELEADALPTPARAVAVGSTLVALVKPVTRVAFEGLLPEEPRHACSMILGAVQDRRDWLDSLPSLPESSYTYELSFTQDTWQWLDSSRLPDADETILERLSRHLAPEVTLVCESNP